MSLNNPIPRGTRVSPTYVADGVSATYAVPFWFLGALDLIVSLTSPSGAPSVLSDAIGYSASGADVSGGGTVTLDAIPVAGTAVKVIGRRIPNRLTSVVNGGTLVSTALEKEFDAIEATEQEMRRDIDALRVVAPSHQFQYGVSDVGEPLFEQPSFADLSGQATPSQLPLPTQETIGGVKAASAPAHQFQKGIGTDGEPLFEQPSFADLSGQATPSQLPLPTQETIGGVKAASAPAHQFQKGIGTDGEPQFAQPNFSDLGGQAAPSQLPWPTPMTLGGVRAATAPTHEFMRGIDGAGLPFFSRPAVDDINGLSLALENPPSTDDYATLSGIVRADIPNLHITLSRFHTNDGAPWKPGTAAGPMAIQDAVGQWWEIDVASVLHVNIMWFEADKTGIADSTTACRKAIATGRSIFVPTGIYKLTDIISLQNGQTMFGEGRTQSVFTADAATFNMVALGMIRLANGEPGATLLDIGIDPDQPDVSTRAECNQYPPAIYAVGAPRFQIDRVRISNAWDGLNATGNSGGAYIGRLEIGALNKAMRWDNSLDFVHIQSVHCWPFGILDKPNLYNNVYVDQTTVAAEFGRVDGLQIGNFASFKGKVVFTAAAGNSSGLHINSLDLDGTGAVLSIAGGFVQIDAIRGSPSNFSINPLIDSTGGVLTIGDFSPVSGATIPDVRVTGGGVYITGGNWLHNDANSSAGVVTNGTLSVANTRVNTVAGNHSVPLFSQNGGSLRIDGVNGAALLVGNTGIAVEFLTDSEGNFIGGGTRFPNWQYNIPFPTSLGWYDVDASFAISVTPSFQTLGDFAPTNVVVNGIYQRNGNCVHAELSVQFDTNAFTTAAGAFQLVTNLPNSKQSYVPFLLGAVSNVASTALQIAAELQTPNIYFRQVSSNAAYSSYGTSFVLPSKVGVLFRLSAIYQVK